MKLHKIALAACIAGTMGMVAAPAHAAAYYIGGKWYYFSLDFEATLAKVTGKELNDGTTVNATVTVTKSEVQCVNPQGQLVDPGQGPSATLTASSDTVTDADAVDLSRTANKVTGNTYKKKLAVPLPQIAATNPCKTSSGVGEWKPTYWKFDNCLRGVSDTTPNACYADRAYFVDGQLTYLNGVPVAMDNPAGATDAERWSSWTLVYLPAEYSYLGTITTGGVDSKEAAKGVCTFGLNTESGAKFSGQPYSLSNPPVLGWAFAPVPYQCTFTRFQLP
ncbi:MAG: hypothetical protein U1F00_16800 [Rhodoferax sp.]